jgi:hypothetical protein
MVPYLLEETENDELMCRDSARSTRPWFIKKVRFVEKHFNKRFGYAVHHTTPFPKLVGVWMKNRTAEPLCMVVCMYVFQWEPLNFLHFKGL